MHRLWDDQQAGPPHDEEMAIADEEIFNFRPIQDRANRVPEIPDDQQQQPLPEQAIQGD